MVTGLEHLLCDELSVSPLHMQFVHPSHTLMKGACVSIFHPRKLSLRGSNACVVTRPLSLERPA